MAFENVLLFICDLDFSWLNEFENFNSQSD